MNTTKRTISCFCENTFEAEIPDSVDLAAEPGVVAQVLSGDFMSVACPLCGKRLTLEFPCLFSGAEADRDIYFVPELDRVSYLRGKLSYDIGKPWRVVIGFAELAEKLRIVSEALDDRVIEIMKYYLLTRSSAGSADAEAEPGERDREVTILYSGEENGKLVFHMSGLRKGEVAVARLGRDIYSKISADLNNRIGEEPFTDFCVPPYVSLRRVE
jgi:hypothetical protein